MISYSLFTLTFANASASLFALLQVWMKEPHNAFAWAMILFKVEKVESQMGCGLSINPKGYIF